MKIIVIAALMFLIGCSNSSSKKPPEVERRGRFNVTVRSGGKEIGGEQLVHRYTLKQTELAEVAKSLKAIKFSSVEDGSGGIKGIELSEGCSPLGLERGDVLTAVGLSPARELTQLEQALVSLKGEGPLTFTFERSSMPHKTLVALAN